MPVRLQQDYPARTKYRYYVHLTNGRYLGPFERGYWRKDPPNGELRLWFTRPGMKGRWSPNLATIAGIQIRHVEAKTPLSPLIEKDLRKAFRETLERMKRARLREEKELEKRKKQLAEWRAAEKVRLAKWAKSVTRCRKGERKERLTGSTTAGFALDRIEDEEPSTAGPVMDFLKKRLGSASHVKCWLFAYYRRKTTKTFTTYECNGKKWVAVGSTTIETIDWVKVHLGLNGYHCQAEAILRRLAAKRNPGLRSPPDWGTIVKRWSETKKGS